MPTWGNHIMCARYDFVQSKCQLNGGFIDTGKINRFQIIDISLQEPMLYLVKVSWKSPLPCLSDSSSPPPLKRVS